MSEYYIRKGGVVGCGKRAAVRERTLNCLLHNFATR